MAKRKPAATNPTRAPATRKPRIALVLSGGGARGAYEAGILRYLREELPEPARSQVRFDILCGTSVGAITACYIAATLEHPEDQGRRLASVWTSLRLEKVYKLQDANLWTLTRRMWRLAMTETPRPEGWRIYDILHPAPLEEIVRTEIPWANIGANLAAGRCEALAVSATEIVTGKTVVFVQQRAPGLPAWSRDPFVAARETVIGPDHAIASAAIPLLFRSVEIDARFYCDGGLRQNTPLSPALRLGADKVLVVGLRHEPSAEEMKRLEEDDDAKYPSTPLVMGKVLNALLLDHTDYDIDRMRRFSALIAGGEKAFGKNFVARLNEVLVPLRGQGYRRVDDLVIRPSKDIAAIAGKHAKKGRSLDANATLPTKLLHRLARTQLVSEADLASYLLFDGEYAADLIELGMADARARKDELVSFFTD
jgi:NTE family protein